MQGVAFHAHQASEGAAVCAPDAASQGRIHPHILHLISHLKVKGYIAELMSHG